MTWKDIPGFEGRYQANPDGRIRTLAWRCNLTPVKRRRKPPQIRELKPSLGDDYPRVQLGAGNHRHVHELILLTFVGPRPPGFECNHDNGIKADNRLANLAWVTPSENQAHAWKTGLHGEKSLQAVKKNLSFAARGL